MTAGAPAAGLSTGPSNTTRAARRVVLVCANDFEQPPLNLGASAKVASLVRMFDRLGYEVHYVDSSHQVPSLAAPLNGVASRVGTVPVSLWRPFKLPNRKLGKVLNVLAAAPLQRRLAALQPDLVWLYNAYAFEGAIGQPLARQGVPVVLELEDLPLARHRGLNPKPRWDQRAFEALLPVASLVTFVNEGLLKRLGPRVRRSMLLPSILGDGLSAPRPAAPFTQAPFQVGYFGGLEQEKGAGILLQALPRLPEHWQMVVTGAGSLAADFTRAAAADPRRLAFHGTVDTARLHALMRGCDVIANPHRSIESMDGGVFPFKVCESIAAGALLLSTPLPAFGEDTDGALMAFDGSADGLCRALAQAPAFHARQLARVQALRERVLARYSESALCRQLGVLLDDILSPRSARPPAAPEEAAA